MNAGTLSELHGGYAASSVYNFFDEGGTEREYISPQRRKDAKEPLRTLRQLRTFVPLCEVYFSSAVSTLNKGMRKRAT